MAMKVKEPLLLLAILLAIGSNAWSDSLQPFSILDNGFQDDALDSIRSVDSLIAINEKHHTYKSETISVNEPISPSTDKTKKPWPTGALLRSAVVPGWGQVYNKQYIKAVIYGGTEIALAYTTAHYWKQMDKHQQNFMNSTNKTYQVQEFYNYQNSRDNRNLFLWLTGLTFFVSIFDAYVDAHFADFDQQDKAFEANLFPKNNGFYLSLSYNLK
jgi:hypothetical protein